jgi:hypothetical protein
MTLDFRDPVQNADAERRGDPIIHVKLPLYSGEFGSLAELAASDQLTVTDAIRQAIDNYVAEANGNKVTVRFHPRAHDGLSEVAASEKLTLDVAITS